MSPCEVTMNNVTWISLVVATVLKLQSLDTLTRRTVCACLCVCCRLLRRLATLLSQQASLLASNEAFKKQAEGASAAARKYLEDNELLQEVTHKHITFRKTCLFETFVLRKT